MNTYKTLIGTIVLWLLIIIGFVGNELLARSGGQTVLLKTIPVDPVDYFRGDYVVLDYEIEQDFLIDTNMAWEEREQCIEENNKECRQTGTLYLELQKDKEGIATLLKAHETKPKKGLFIKGEFNGSWRGGLDFGIENFFVPRGKGHYLERIDREKMFVKAHISKTGKARIISVLVDGEEIDWSEIKKRKKL